MDARKGRIVTFYSYKGGTGRSLLLANAALVLASNDKRVAVIDWDLEAPGLHRYFKPFIADTELSETTGLIDLFTGYWDRLTELNSVETEPPTGWELPFLDVYRYGVTLRMPEGTRGGSILFVPAGRQNAAYASKVSNFDWDAFYSDAGGRGFIDALAEQLRSQFDYVLIDSRTGVSDTAGICTVHLPDELVICFTYNNQNVLGAAGVAAAVNRERNGPSSEHRLRIFPVPTRADYFLQTYLGPRRRLVKQQLGWVLPDEERRESDRYWADVEQPYLPVHSYFETLACLTDDPESPPPSLLIATQNVVRRFTGGEVQRWIPIFDEAQRQALRRVMEGEGSDSAAPVSASTHAGGPAHLSAPPSWTEADIAAARPFLLRLLFQPPDGLPLVFRAVPAVSFDHISRDTDRLLQVGFLVIRAGVGGSNLVELSSLARVDEAGLLQKLNDLGQLNARLLEIEDAARRWRSSGGLDVSLLKNVQWLKAHSVEVESLKTQRALTMGEELFLLTCSRRAEQASVRRRTTSLAATAFLLLVGAIVWAAQQKLESARQVAALEQERGALAERAKSATEQVAQLQKQVAQAQFTSLLGMGHDAFARKNYDEAVKRFTEAEAQAAQPNADLYRARGDAYDRLATASASAFETYELRRKSLDDFEKWVSLAETAPRHLQVAQLLLKYDRPDRALVHVERASQLAATEPSVYLSENGPKLATPLLEKNLITKQQFADWVARFRTQPDKAAGRSKSSG